MRHSSLNKVAVIHEFDASLSGNFLRINRKYHLSRGYDMERILDIDQSLLLVRTNLARHLPTKIYIIHCRSLFNDKIRQLQYLCTKLKKGSSEK